MTMFSALSDKMRGLVSLFSGKQKLTEENIAEAVTEVRLALLEADVNYGVVKELIKQIKIKALGENLIKSVSPGQQFIKAVHDSLVSLMGEEENPLDLSVHPTIILMCGLQGSGKTTQCAKLARYYVKQGLAKHPLLVACDLQRLAAVEQLKLLGTQIGVPVFSLPGENNPLKVAEALLKELKNGSHDLIIVDTAGRLHIDELLMEQLTQLQKLLAPQHVLFVANAATGQEAANVAAQFSARVPISGSIVTMLDGNARGGAAISIRHVTGKPLLFEGIGEKVDDLRSFHPRSMADRILGMGDTINLVRKAQEHIDEDDAKQLEKKLRSATFTYEDYVAQIQTVKKMGSLKGIFSMFPGLGNMKPFDDADEKEFFKVEAMIHSMTPNERAEKCELSPSRRKRIAKGSGLAIEDVNKMVKSFKKTKQMFKNLPPMKQLQKMLGGGALWH